MSGTVPAGLTASAVAVDSESRKRLSRVGAPWQDRAFLYYDLLGEIWYASQFYGRNLSKLKLKIRDVTTGADVTAGPAVDALARVFGDANASASLLGTYGRLMFLAGEGILFATVEGDSESWEMLSTLELKIKKTEFERKRSQSAKIETIPDGHAVNAAAVPDVAVGGDRVEPVGPVGYAYRLWRRHPMYSDEADAPMRAVLDTCEELLTLGYATRSRARSHATRAGMLLAPNDSPPPTSPNEKPFKERFEEHILAQLEDEASAANVVPMIVWWNPDSIEKWKLLQLASDVEKAYPESQIRMEAVKRLAIGLDMPPEVLMGVTDANHWTAWQIDEDSWKAHLEPLVRVLVDDLTTAYLVPTLAAAGEADPARFRVWYDEAEIVNRPDRSAQAMEAHDRSLISDEAARRELGFAETDKPDPDDGAANEDEDAPAEPKGDGVDGPPEQAAAAIVATLRTRARAAAGARLRTRVTRANGQVTPDVRRRVERAAATNVAAALGEATLVGMGLEPARLVAGSLDDFKPTLVHLGWDEAAADAMIAGALHDAARSLFDAEPC